MQEAVGGGLNSIIYRCCSLTA